MIVKMKKITLLVAEPERDDFLSALRVAGAVHVAPVKEPDTQSLDDTRKQLEKTNKVIDILSHYQDGPFPKNKKWSEDRYREKVREVSESFYEKEQFLKDIHILAQEKAKFDLWGAFDPGDAAGLKEKNIDIRLYRLGKSEIKEIEKISSFTILGKDKQYIYGCLVNCEVPPGLNLEEMSFPSDKPEAIDEKIKALEKLVRKKEKHLREEAAGIDCFNRLKKVMESRQEFLSVKFGMAEENKFSYLQGFCPEKDLKKVSVLAREKGAGYFIEEPDNPSLVPTLITNPRWISIIDPVFKFMNTVPGYDEFDISFVFLIFFSLFFAMLVGDAGYGIIFLVATFVARRKMKNAPAAPFFLMYVLSGATILWGAASGTWFGAEGIAQLPIFKSVIVSKISSFGPSNQLFMMYLSFIIGVVHLTIAHLKKGLRVINSPLAFAQIGWIGILWGMFFAAGTLVVGKVFPTFAGYLLGAGIMMVLVFENYQKNIMKGIIETLTSLPLNVISSFSDIVSYLRLFAVGYATVIVAESFNSMAIGDGINSIVGGLIAALILFMGHALNIILAIMAVVVHGIRLNVLEFSGHLGMQWTGEEYAPFKEAGKVVHSK